MKNGRLADDEEEEDPVELKTSSLNSAKSSASFSPLANKSSSVLWERGPTGATRAHRRPCHPLGHLHLNLVRPALFVLTRHDPPFIQGADAHMSILACTQNSPSKPGGQEHSSLIPLRVQDPPLWQTVCTQVAGIGAAAWLE